MKIELWIAALIFIFSATAHAASFDCAKAKTLIEKMICSDESLSKLDELLNKTYKKQLSYAATLPEIQLSWLSNIRNKCKDVECLKSTYKSRIEKLNKQEDLASNNCRKETCWWDYIKEQKTVKETDNNKLFKVTVIRKVGTYPDRLGDDEYVKQNNIVKSERKDNYEYFAFCAKKLPVLIDCDTKKCDGEFILGAHYERQDIYNRICNEIDENEIPENLKVENLEIKLKNPLEIFDYYKKLF